MPPKGNKAASPAASATREASSEGRSSRSVSDGERTTRSESNPASANQEPSEASTSNEASSRKANNNRSASSTGAVPKTANTTTTRSTTTTVSRSSSRNGAVHKTANATGTGSTSGAATRTSRRVGTVPNSANSTGGAVPKNANSTGGAVPNSANSTGGAVPKTANSTGGAVPKSANSTGGAVPKTANATGAVPKTGCASGTTSRTSNRTGAVPKTTLTTGELSRTKSASGTAPASRTSNTSMATSGLVTTTSSISAENASIIIEDNSTNPTPLSVWDMTVDLTSPSRGNISTTFNMRVAGISTPSNMRGINNLGILDNLDELTIVSPRPSPQRQARRPRTPLARNTMGSRYTMSPPRQHPGLTSHFSSTATPPRSRNVLDMTIDLTDSPLATPGSPEEISPAGTSGESGIRCPVCLDGVPHIKSTRRTMMSTLCGHIFCSTCLPACIRSNGRCPTCRKVLRHNDIHPIFI